MVRDLRIGMMQLTMEPLGDILSHAERLDKGGFDTIWLAEAYPWWRLHSMEARSSTALSALIGRVTSRLQVGWGIISPYTRHPIQVAMEARVSQEALGPGRLKIGFGASKIFMREAGIGTRGPALPTDTIRESIEIVRAVLSGEELDYHGRVFDAVVPALRPDAETPRDEVPIYVAGTGPRLQQMAGEIASGLLTPSITTPEFVRRSRRNLAEGAERAGRDPETISLGCTIVASIDEDRDKGREGAREIAGMYLANKVENIQASADELLESAGLDREEIRPVAEAMRQGGRLAAARAVSDSILDRTRPIAGTPSDCIAAIEEYAEAGCTDVMLELWGERREAQLELFASRVLPHVAR
ncbi:MAG: LLM class flavin-dependent oxidoreductase [Actinomycetota bacterium]|nr:LLM class flavin-dependent oxidoreductase [Actinomycetota bacterium]